MKKVTIILLMLCAYVTTIGCSIKNNVIVNYTEISENDKIGYHYIFPEDAKTRLDTEKGIILLDVRTEKDYAEKHIPRSELIPLEVLKKEAKLKLRDKNAVIFVYCKTGDKSLAASKILVQLGYTNVYNLGGIIDWPYETESSSK